MSALSVVRALFRHELEHQLESSLLCDCRLWSWNNIFLDTFNSKVQIGEFLKKRKIELPLF